MIKNFYTSLVVLKSFGDLTIAMASIRRLSSESLKKTSLVIGSHLVDLCQILKPPCAVFTLTHDEGDVPALFDIHRRGIFAALKCTIQIRSIFKDNLAKTCGEFIFDRITWREQLLIGGIKAGGLPVNQPNIYIAYENFLKSRFTLSDPLVPVVIKANRKRVGIFPGSRVENKKIPPIIIERIAKHCFEMGFEAVIFVLDGEEINDISGIPIVKLPRNFSSLASAVNDVGVAICADSLSAHLASYYNVPVFVASPINNSYWLPYSAYINGSSGVFGDLVGMDQALDRFLLNI